MIGDPIEKERDSILQVLSRGEKRAFYILQFLFEIEARKKTNTESLIILDDIADSFDYKNKYAIVEYINDLNKTGLFKQIILTHNFDFYRTIVSRLNLESSAFMATCNNEEVKIKQGRYLKDVFKRYLTPNANQPKIFISLIPFVRNIVEYTKGDGPEYKNLTSCLHIKEETEKIRAIDICKILKKNIEHCKDLDINAFSNRKIYDLIIETADAIIKEDIIDDILLENKMVLSIAIRLKTEKYLIHKLEGRININEINHDQTRVLIDKYKDIITKEDKIDKILERVNLMTPENIHVNTFMYEPLIDMSVNHLVDLYKDISNLT